MFNNLEEKSTGISHGGDSDVIALHHTNFPKLSQYIEIVEKKNPRIQINLKNRIPFYKSTYLSILYQSTVGGVGGMSLPLSLEIVGTNISLCDNEGAILQVGAGGWENKGRELKQAEASLEMRMRVAASFEASNSREYGGPICADRSRAHG